MVKLVVDINKQGKLERKPKKILPKTDDLTVSGTEKSLGIDDFGEESRNIARSRKKKEIVTIEYTDFITNEAELWTRLQPKKGELRNWLTKNQPRQLECKREGVLSQLVLVFNELMTAKVDEFKKKSII